MAIRSALRGRLFLFRTSFEKLAFLVVRIELNGRSYGLCLCLHLASPGSLSLSAKDAEDRAIVDLSLGRRTASLDA